ncbi:hypothetical protein OIV83_002768 [Microbotryomycetes sp. JL201]|nr:hypothetical protein OIV83_002768 [Microbotryomycetes sp. JL201]
MAHSGVYRYESFFALQANELEVSIFADATCVRAAFAKHMETEANQSSEEDSAGQDSDTQDDAEHAHLPRPSPRDCEEAGITNFEWQLPGVKIDTAIWLVLEIAFDSTGWEEAGQRLQELSAPLAAAGISILFGGAFHADYILIRAADLDAVTSILESKGFQFNDSESDNEPFVEPDPIRRIKVQDEFETSLASGKSPLQRVGSSTSRRSGGGASLAGSLTLSDKSDPDHRGRPIDVLPSIQTHTLPDTALADNFSLLPDELIQIGLATGNAELLWRSKIVEALFFPQHVLPPTFEQRKERSELRRSGLTASQLLNVGSLSPLRTRGVHRSPSLSSSVHEKQQQADSAATTDSAYPIPYMVLTQTSDGSSLTADVRLLRAVFDEQEEEQMVYAIGQGGLRGLWQGENGVADSDSSDVEETDDGGAQGWEQVERHELIGEKKLRKAEGKKAGDGGRSLLKCLQLDLVNFGLDKTGIVNQVAGILARSGINCVYQSTFSSANVLVAKCDIARARRALEAAQFSAFAR